MRFKKGLIPTLKEDPKDAIIKSHKLLIKAGYIRSVGSGIYSYLPLGYRAIRKVMNVIREEMDAIDAQELVLPILTPAELWKETGRWDAYGGEMFRLKDRKDHDMALAPTHEELITDLARKEIRSYKDMPQIWYHFQWKFRDEIRPRSGLLRTRSFIMKDSYSLDASFEELHESYKKHFNAYSRVFTRLGLKFHIVSASSGLMGGSASQEFMVESEIGEDRIVVCDKCGYASNVEVAEAAIEPVTGEDTKIEYIDTPVKGDVKTVAEYVGKSPKYFIKSLLYIVKSKPVFVLIRGDLDIEEEKLTRVFGAEYRAATDDEVVGVTGCAPGYISPYGLGGIEVIADFSIKGGKGLITGANRRGQHIIGVNVERDLNVTKFADIMKVRDGDRCKKCGAPLRSINTIELGHIFELGTKYSESMHAYFLDKNGNEQPIVMGSYGIGVERLLQTCVEVFSDKNGIILPRIIAPFEVIVMPLNSGDELVMREAEDIYKILKDKRIDVLIDDRDMRAGGKFKDADLIGIPVQVRIGRKAKEGIFEIKIRKTGEIMEVKKENILDKLNEIFRREDI